MASLLKLFRTTQPDSNADSTQTQPHTDEDSLVPDATDEQKRAGPVVPPAAEHAAPAALDSDSEHDSVGGSFETLEDEIRFLRSQNSKLKHTCRHLRSRHHQLLRSNLAETGVMTMKVNGQLVRVQQPQLDISLDELANKVEARLPKFLSSLARGDPDTVCVPSESGAEHEVGVIDITSVDWGALVQLDTVDTCDALKALAGDDDELEVESTEALGGAFIVLRESDIIDAIASFVAQCVLQIPECHNVDHDQMLALITGTFSELKSKGPLGRMQDWGAFIYATYGYTATAYTVYSNAAMAKTVLSCLVSAAWLIGVL